MLFASLPGLMHLRVCAQKGALLEAGGFVAPAKHILDLAPINQRMCLCKFVLLNLFSLIIHSYPKKTSITTILNEVKPISLS